MTEHPHMPSISQFKIYRLSPSQINVVIRGIDIVLNREESEELVRMVLTAFEEPTE